MVWKLAPVGWDGMQQESVNFAWWWQTLNLLGLDKTNQARIRLHTVDAKENSKLVGFEWRTTIREGNCGPGMGRMERVLWGPGRNPSARTSTTHKPNPGEGYGEADCCRVYYTVYQYM